MISATPPQNIMLDAQPCPVASRFAEGIEMLEGQRCSDVERRKKRKQDTLHVPIQTGTWVREQDAPPPPPLAIDRTKAVVNWLTVHFLSS